MKISHFFLSFFSLILVGIFFSVSIVHITFGSGDDVEPQGGSATSVTKADSDAANKADKSAAEITKCIEDSTGGGDKPIDVCYHYSKNTNIDLRQFGELSSEKSVGTIAQKMLKFFLAILGGVALLAIGIGGGMIMMGGSDETLLEKGKDVLKFTIIGVVVVLLAVTITTLVQTFLYSFEV